eukprot:TRINITY_DN37667_c0_g1_i1.p1 TRINITY_DN37667_c0_g1~~TRINITY_DN37667_c0_g1_i1.p1  ORF type:complete len:1619 (+),score=413.28 TRINITY_DN37667_c0_g1_i1:175-5031(+)
MAPKKAKKKPADTRGYATASLPSAASEAKKAEAEAKAAEEKAAAEEAAAEAARAAAAAAEAAAAAASAGDAGEGADEEEWERAGERLEEREAEAAAARAAARVSQGPQDDTALDLNDEEWEKAVEKRLEDELQKCLDKRFVPPDATHQFERHSSYAPAGVVVLGSAVEQKLEAALTPLRQSVAEPSSTDEAAASETTLRPIFPKHWKYKGKLTYERLSNIYSALLSLNFKSEHIKTAMEKTFGYDVRAAMEYLLVTLPKVDLPRQFGGEGTGDHPPASEAVKAVESSPTAQSTTSTEAKKQEASTATAEASPEGEADASPDADDDAADEDRGEASKAVDADDDEVGESGEDDQEDEDDSPEEKSSRGKPAAQQETAAQLAQKDRDSVKDINKRLAMQFMQNHDSDEELINAEEKLERERKKDPTARYVKIAQQVEELVKLCQQLKSKKKQGGNFKSNNNADQRKQREAAAKVAHLRTEMEALENGRYGPLDKAAVDNFRNALKKTAADAERKRQDREEKAAAAQAAAAAAKDAKEQEGDEEMPSIFDGTLDDDSAPAPKDTRPAVRQYNSAGWNGKTPKQCLEEYLRKRVWGKSPPDKVATYARRNDVSTPGRMYSQVTLPQPRNKPTMVIAPDEPCETERDANNLAAILTIYKLSELHDHGEVCRGISPVWKARLQEYVDEAAAREREIRREQVRGRVTFVERLLRHKPPAAALSSQAWMDASTGDQPNSLVPTVREDDLDFTELGAEQKAKLREDFAYRREILAERHDYKEIQEVRSRLPVAAYRDNLLRAVKCNGVLIVSGATGSGKTTQVPQFVLEDALLDAQSDDPMPNIIVTEPRRISAVSVAQRVSQEMGDPAGGPGARGSLVGYQIRLEKKASDSCRLLFCTVGVLLKKMQGTGLGVLSKVTHIFIDEIHERSADCDLLLLLLRQIRYQRLELKLVLMSATLEVKKLVKYFGNMVPVVDVPGRTFPVSSYFLEDVIEMTGYECGEETEFAKRGWGSWSQKQTFQVTAAKGKTQTLTEFIDDDDEFACDDEAESCDPGSYHRETLKALAKMDHTRINYQLIVMMIEYIEGSEHFQQGVPREDGAVLIFLPGLGEITKCSEWISRSPVLGDQRRYVVISLHSVLSSDDHAKAFVRPPRGKRKIVLSTNIAETGVTIPDVVYVIDAGKVKSQQYHEPTNTSSLKEKFVSRAEVKQRAGRAGRVREGFSFCLMTKKRLELRCQELPTPEMLRCSLMELMLSVLSSGLQPSCFLEALDPPPRARIDQAITTLKATGAVEEGVRPANAMQIGAVVDDTWYVPTPIGLCLSRLPCDLRLGKMVLLSALFGGVDSVVTIAATLSHRSPFATPFSDSKRAQARAVHQAEFLAKDGPPSDHVALNTAFLRWEDAKKNSRSVEKFLQQQWLSGGVLQTIREIRTDLMSTLKGEGFCEVYEKTEVHPQDIRSPHTVAALLFAGLYPNVARTDPPKSATEKNPLLFAGNEALKLHPGSLCAGRVENLHKTNCRWICYHTKMKTSQVFLRDASFITPNALLLFGGESASLMNIHPVEKSVSIGIGGERHWQTFFCNPRHAALIRQLRYAFDAVLRRKATAPRQPLSPDDRLIIAAYISIINSAD